MIQDRYSIKDGYIFWEDSKVCTENGYPFHNLEFIERLSEGANGITYVARHKFLENFQVIKFSKTDIQKSLLEAQKNSNVEISETIASISDLGILSIPSKVCYSVMPMINNSVTLKQWITARDSILELFTHNLSAYNIGDKSGTNAICQLSLNVGSALLFSYSKLIGNHIVHGDLNSKNILVKDKLIDAMLVQTLEEIKNIGQDLTESEVDRASELINSVVDKIKEWIPTVVLGRIDSKIDIKLIDMGTSQFDGANKLIGEQRDNYFLVDSFRKILKPFFSGTSMIQFLNIDRNLFKDRTVKLYIHDTKLDSLFSSYPTPYSPIDPYDIENAYNGSLPKPFLVNHPEMVSCIPFMKGSEWIPRKLVAGDLLRLITFINVIYGYYSVNGMFSDEVNNICEFNSYIKRHDKKNHLDIEVFSSNHVSAWERLVYSESACSTGELIFWDKLWEAFRSFNKSPIKNILNYLDIQNRTVVLSDDGQEFLKDLRSKNDQSLFPPRDGGYLE
ncbi:TPA: hypothetical protein U0J71_001389 [Streptococcus suis]|nr:hypothetical protein [Streptococcus suis]